MLKPERCYIAEPYKREYDSSQLMEYTRWLSSSSGAFFFKKTKGIKYEANIDNWQFGVTWWDNKRTIINEYWKQSTRYLSSFMIFFEHRNRWVKSQDISFFENLMDDITQLLQADRGYIMVDGEVVKRFGDLIDKEIW